MKNSIYEEERVFEGIENGENGDTGKVLAVMTVAFIVFIEGVCRITGKNDSTMLGDIAKGLIKGLIIGKNGSE